MNKKEIIIKISLKPIEKKENILNKEQTIQQKTKENNKKKTINSFFKEFSQEFLKQLILFVLVVLPLTALIYHLFIRP